MLFPILNFTILNTKKCRQVNSLTVMLKCRYSMFGVSLIYETSNSVKKKERKTLINDMLSGLILDCFPLLPPF